MYNILIMMSKSLSEHMMILMAIMKALTASGRRKKLLQQSCLSSAKKSENQLESEVSPS